MRNLIISVLASFLILVLLCPGAFAQSRKEKKEQKLEESAKPKSAPGGVKFQVQKSYQDSYDALLNWAKRADYTIDKADKETGQIITAMAVTGGYSQTGTRVFLTLIKDSESATTVKVAVSEQKRKKLLQTEPWSDPNVNEKESSSLADKVKAALQ